jgi:hypothetical protein
MARRYQGPQREAIRRNLADLIAEGLVPYNVVEKGGNLLRLTLVTERLSLRPDADEDERDAAYARALTDALREAVSSIEMRRSYRRVLNCVLPLNPDYVKASVQERRSAAGKAIKDGTKLVKPGTIRTYHEPRALDALANILVAMEAKNRGEEVPGEEAPTPTSASR